MVKILASGNEVGYNRQSRGAPNPAHGQIVLAIQDRKLSATRSGTLLIMGKRRGRGVREFDSITRRGLVVRDNVGRPS